MIYSAIKITLLALLLCSGCGGAYPYGIPAREEEYKIGYTHGCDSAHHAKGDKAYAWRADYFRDNYSTSYIPGWRAGFIECVERLEGRRNK